MTIIPTNPRRTPSNDDAALTGPRPHDRSTRATRPLAPVGLLASLCGTRSATFAVLRLVVVALAIVGAGPTAQDANGDGPIGGLADGSPSPAAAAAQDSVVSALANSGLAQDPGAGGSATGTRSARPTVSIDLGNGANQNLNTGIELFLFMTLLAFAPAIVMTMTCFPRVIIVLSFLRRAMSIQELPPTLVVSGFAVFLTIFIMMPVVDDIYTTAYQPYVAEDIGFSEAAERATGRLRDFMLRQTREDDIALVLELSNTPRPSTPDDVPFHVVVPSFILSEIKTAFQMGFVLFLPFVVIDLVISSILISMGMFTLPPVVVSTPLKILLFIMVDGWNLVVASLFASFPAT